MTVRLPLLCLPKTSTACTSVSLVKRCLLPGGFVLSAGLTTTTRLMMPTQ